MSKTISICNQKGGTGKTTTAVNLSAALAEIGKRVLLIDLDPQGNATSGLGVNKSELKLSAYDLILNKAPVQEVLIKDVLNNLDMIGCNINLTGAEIELVGSISRETRLKKAIESIVEGYDYVFVDSPPSLGMLTLNSLVSCQSIIIPIQCEFYALEGVSQLLNTINLIKDNLNPNIQIEGVLLTMADYRTNLTNEVIREISSFFKNKVYKSIIPRNVRLSEAPSYGKPITIYDTNSLGAKKYRELAKEVAGIEVTEELSNVQSD
ncbi:MAG: ParA family protein [Candidatus Moranbacteria bacterium]|nr:ParA family protein [Candidatus Moranbacteria bacterium]